MFLLISSCLLNKTIFFKHFDLGFVCTVLLNIWLEKFNIIKILLQVYNDIFKEISWLSNEKFLAYL